MVGTIPIGSPGTALASGRMVGQPRLRLYRGSVEPDHAKELTISGMA